MNKKLIISGIALCIFFVFKFQFHEFWKDEWQAFLVARDMSVTSIFKFLNYEGHPALWYLYLKPFTFLSNVIDESTLINIAHGLPLIACVYLLVTKFELHWLHTLLFFLSYFFCFEYGIVNRGYVLVELLAIICIWAMQQNRTGYFSVFLILLCQTEIYGVILASVLGLYSFIDQKINRIPLYLSWLIGVSIFIFSVYPRGHAEEFTRAYNQSSVSITSIFNAFQGLFANVFAIGLIDDTAIYGYSTIGLVISGIILVLLTYIFFEDKKVLYTWILGTLMMFSFTAVVFLGGIRQWGFMFILFFLLLLLSPSIIQKKVKWIATILLMLAPLVYNFRALYKESVIPFSNAKEAGKFILSSIPENVAIVSLNKFETGAAAAYARRKMFELPSGTPFTYFKWLEKVYVPTQSELMLFAKYKGAKGLIVVSPKLLDQNRFPILKLWKKFDQPNLKSEEYYFYILDLTGRNG